MVKQFVWVKIEHAHILDRSVYLPMSDIVNYVYLNKSWIAELTPVSFVLKRCVYET